MRGKRRDKIEVIRDFLKLLTSPEYKNLRFTRLMQLTNIQYTSFKKMLAHLNSQGLIEYQPNHNGRKRVDKRIVETVKITNKGRDALDLINELLSILYDGDSVSAVDFIKLNPQ
jgi:predicted transcriptional regulator